MYVNQDITQTQTTKDVVNLVTQLVVLAVDQVHISACYVLSTLSWQQITLVSALLVLIGIHRMQMSVYLVLSTAKLVRIAWITPAPLATQTRISFFNHHRQTHLLDNVSVLMDTNTFKIPFSKDTAGYAMFLVKLVMVCWTAIVCHAQTTPNFLTLDSAAARLGFI